MTATVSKFPARRIPISGANNRDIKATVAHIELLTGLFKSAILESTKLYRDAMLSALVNHNENVPITRTARLGYFKTYFDSTLEEFLGGVTDLTGDVVADVQRALEE